MTDYNIESILEDNAWCTQAIEIICAAMDGQMTEEEYNLVFNRK